MGRERYRVRAMHQVADGVWHIPLVRGGLVNAYLLGDVLVDAGMQSSARRLLAAIDGRRVTAHALTHAHPDHVGGSRRVIDALGVPFWAPAGDAEACERGVAVQKDGPLKGLRELGARFPAVRVDRTLAEGDEVGPGFRVIEVPGHSPGHIAFWREADRVLVCGDVWFNVDFKTLRPRLRAPFSLPTVDPDRNRASMRRLIGLQPQVVCFGHGPVMTDAADKLRVC
jgi:glyoxylase-like metal-dependent hydrolase (beta-lactamase superfamily II)